MMGDLGGDRPYGKQQAPAQEQPVTRNLSKVESQMALDFNKPMSISRRGTPDELDRPLPGADDYED